MLRRLALLAVVAALLAPVAARAAAPAPPPPNGVYVVVAGDTLFSIARRFGTTVRQLARLNDLAPNGMLAIGTRLRLVQEKPRAAPLPPARPATQVTETLARRLRRALAAKGLSLRTTGAYVVDVVTGRPVYALNADLPVPPASIEKLPLAFALLRNLGAGFRTHTDVLGVGAREGAVWSGDLVLEGYGDPGLHRDDLLRLARQVRAAGIARVSGRLVADESYFDTRRDVAGWKPSFAGEESAPLSALVVDRARVDGHVSSDPARAALVLFRRALLRAGVEVGTERSVGVAPAGAPVLATVASPRLATLVRFMLKQSDNYVAETLLKELGAQIGGVGTSAAGASIVLQTLTGAGIHTEGTVIVDGSGLSLEDRISARTLVELLVTLRSDATVGPLVTAGLPVAGVDGTLRRRLVGTRLVGLVRAKTGTTNESSGLAGYLGDRYAFALIESGSFVPAWIAHTAQDRFLLAVARSDA